MATAKNKIKKLGEVIKITQKAKGVGKKVVTTSGCFDLLHLGHVRYLEHAKSLGDILIVGVNSDESVKRNKGPRRPLVPQKERAELLVALKPVDFVFIFDEETPARWIQKIKPDVFAKGSDYTVNEIRGVIGNVVEKNGGRIMLVPEVKGRSTTELIRRIARLGKNYRKKPQR